MSTTGEPARQAGETLSRLVKTTRDHGVPRMFDQVHTMDCDARAACVVAAVILLDQHRAFDPPPNEADT